MKSVSQKEYQKFIPPGMVPIEQIDIDSLRNYTWYSMWVEDDLGGGWRDRRYATPTTGFDLVPGTRIAAVKV
jgi:hypothetical protein